MWPYSPQTSSCPLPLPLITIFCLTTFPSTFMSDFFFWWGGVLHPYTNWVPEPWIWLTKEWSTYVQIQEIWDWVTWLCWCRSHIPTLLIPHPTTPPPEAQYIYYIQLNKKVRLLNTDKQGGGVIIYSWTRETNLANLSRCSLCRGGVFSYCRHFLHTLSTFALGLKESFSKLPRLIQGKLCRSQGTEALRSLMWLCQYLHSLWMSLFPYSGYCAGSHSCCPCAHDYNNSDTSRRQHFKVLLLIL